MRSCAHLHRPLHYYSATSKSIAKLCGPCSFDEKNEENKHTDTHTTRTTYNTWVCIIYTHAIKKKKHKKIETRQTGLQHTTVVCMQQVYPSSSRPSRKKKPPKSHHGRTPSPCIPSQTRAQRFPSIVRTNTRCHYFFLVSFFGACKNPMLEKKSVSSILFSYQFCSLTYSGEKVQSTP